jgi:hypothetical protein
MLHFGAIYGELLKRSVEHYLISWLIYYILTLNNLAHFYYEIW